MAVVVAHFTVLISEARPEPQQISTGTPERLHVVY